MTAIIIDADPIVYRAGFAAENYAYDCVVEEGGEIEQIMFSPSPKQTAGDKMKQYLKDNPEAKFVGKEKIVEPEPIVFALRGVKMTVQACINDVNRLMLKHHRDDWVDVLDTLVLLTGKGNYRERLATILPYKGNRDKQHRPYHYDAIRQYLQEVWGAGVIEGYEADDECSILAAEYAARGIPAVVCSIDKDLDQIPGMHYDYAKKVLYEISSEDAKRMFWRQCISGDAVDNIQGCYKIGAVKADKLLQRILDAEGDDEAIWQGVVAIYEENMKQYPDKYPNNMSPHQAALETARLVKMQDYRGQLWCPPGQPDGEITDVG